LVKALFFYPVKGLSAQPLDRVELRPGTGIPNDRMFALARPDGRYRPGTRDGLPKQEFFALVSDGRLAGLDTHLDPETEVLTARVAGHEVLKADLSTEDGRDKAVRFFTRVLDLPSGAAPLFAREAGRRFTDAAAAGDGPMNWLSLVNLASVRDLELRTGTVVDPMRFRANVLVDGLPAWTELDLIGREFDLEDVRVRAVHRRPRPTPTTCRAAASISSSVAAGRACPGSGPRRSAMIPSSWRCATVTRSRTLSICPPTLPSRTCWSPGAAA
jgi:uncharacterized protein YcbX